jgi:hypothetical protein
MARDNQFARMMEELERAVSQIGTRYGRVELDMERIGQRRHAAVLKTTISQRFEYERSDVDEYNEGRDQAA